MTPCADLRCSRARRLAPLLATGLFVASFGPALPGRVHAQELETATDELALDREGYLARVREDAPRWLAAPERLASIEAARRVARQRPLPSLTAGLAQLDVSGQGAPTASLVAVDVPFELGRDRASRVDEAEARGASMAAELETETRMLVLAADLAYAEAMAARERARTRATLLEGYERVASLDAMRLERGEIAEAHGLRTALERDRAAMELRGAEDARITAELALGRFVLGGERLRVSARDALPEHHPAHDEAALVAEALSSSPRLAVASAALALARARLARVRAGRVLDPSLRLEWQHNGATSTPQFAQRANDTLALLLTLPFPSGSPRRADVALAVADVATAEAALQALRSRIAAEVRVALAAEREAAQRADTYARVLLPRARALADAASRAYGLDGTTAFELVAARRALEEVELATVEARAAMLRAHLVLEATVHAEP